MRRSLVCALAALLLAPLAQANGRLPMAGQIVLDPRDPAGVLLRTTFGILLSRDGGDTWTYVCESAMHYSGAQDPPYAFTGDGQIALVSSLGYVRGDGLQFAPTVPLRGARDLAIDVGADRAWVLSSQFAQELDGGAYAFASSLIRADATARDVDGARAEPLPSDVLFETVDNVPGDPRRVLLSAASHDAQRRNHGFLFLADDGGEHWHRLEVPLEERENSLYLAAIQAASGQVLVRTYATPNSPSRLLAAPFDALMAAARRGEPAPLREILRHPAALFGVALAEDGSVYAGGAGVWRAPAVGAAFEPMADLRVRCLATRGPALWACADEASGFLAGVSLDGGRTFVPKVRLSAMHAMAVEVAPSCAADWQRLVDEYAAGAVVPPSAAPTQRRWAWFGLIAVFTAISMAGAWLRRRSRRSPAAR